MQREAAVLPGNVVVVPLGNRVFSCVTQQHVTTSCGSHGVQHCSSDARSISETSSGFVSSANSATTTDNRTDTAPPSSNSNSSESCACAQTGSAESLNALIDALQSRHDAYDRSSLRSVELAAGGSAKWSASSSSSASKCLLQERYGEDLRRMNFAARVIQQAYRTHRLKCTFTKRCNEKRLSARISSSCIELDASNDALSYFAADRDTLIAQTQALRTASAEATYKLADSSSTTKSVNQSQTTPKTSSTLSAQTSTTSDDAVAVSNSHKRSATYEDDEDDFVRQSMQRVDAQTAGRPTCSCCECQYGLARLQLHSQSGTPSSLVGRSAFVYTANANTVSNVTAWRNAIDTANSNANLQQQLLMAARPTVTQLSSQISAPAAQLHAACACNKSDCTATPQLAHSRFYMTAPYSLAFFPQSDASNTRVTCPHCAANHSRADRSELDKKQSHVTVDTPLTPLLAARNCDCANARCACERAQLTARQRQNAALLNDVAQRRDIDAIVDSRLRKSKPKPILCAPFFLHSSRSQDEPSNTESIYETSPFWRARRSELAAQTACSVPKSSSSSPSTAHNAVYDSQAHSTHTTNLIELRQRRHYRVALNLFNRKPEIGVRFLADSGIMKNDDPATLANFLLRKRGFSRQAISEYLGSKPPSACKATDKQPYVDRVLECYANGIDMRHLQVLAALRRFQQYVRFCGEAQRIERFADAFAAAYSRQNARIVAGCFRGGVDSVLLLAYAIVMLNTDLHNANVRADRKMKVDEFVRNLSGVDAGADFDRSLLENIYEELRAEPLQSAADHVSQVQKLENCIVAHRAQHKKQKHGVGKNDTELQLAAPQRRLVCYCRLFKISNRADADEKAGEKERQRDVFLLNDLLLIAKERASRSASRKRESKARKDDGAPHPLGYYELCDVYPLNGMQAHAFDSQTHYPYGIRIIAFASEQERQHEERCADKSNPSTSSSNSSKNANDSSSQDGAVRVNLLFYARSSHDRTQFLNDLHETILEATETDYLWNRYKLAAH